MSKDHVSTIRHLPAWKSGVSVKTLGGGMTNFNYLVTDGQKQCVARFAPKSAALLGLNRAREMKNTSIAFSRSIGPKIINFIPRYNLLINEYIDGEVLTPDQARNKENIKKIARLLKKLHSGPKFRGTFDPIKAIEKYIATARTRRSSLPPDINRYLTKLHALKNRIAPITLEYPCHLDLMIENIISVKGNIILIDWEYSANSDPRFDLAMFSVKGKFTARHDAELLKAYSGEISQSELEAMKGIVHFREAAWGFLQSAISEIKFDYKKYARDNLASFNAIADKLLLL